MYCFKLNFYFLIKVNFSESNRKQFNELKEKFKHLNIELKSSKTMLEKSNNSWEKFNESFEVVDGWLEEQEQKKSLADVTAYFVTKKYKIC